MNYYGAREIQRDGKGIGLFHYTCRNDDQIWPVGYCAEACAGHATIEEAQEHYRQYMLDRAKFTGPKTSEWPKHKCEAEGCNEEATHLADIPGSMEPHQFCAAHCNREELAKLVGVGERISSF